MLDKAQTTTAGPDPVALGKPNEVGGLDTGIAPAAVRESVSAMLDSAIMAAITASGRVQETLAAEETPATSVAETTIIPPPPSSPLGPSAEHMAGELSRRGDRGGEENFESEQAVLEHAAETELPPLPQQLNTVNASPMSQGEVEPAVISDADRTTIYASNKDDVRDGVEQEKDRGENDNKQQDQGNIVQETEDPKTSDVNRGQEGSKENKEGTKKFEQFKDGDGRVVHSSGPEDGTTVWVFGRREGAVVQVVEQLHPSYQLVVLVRVAASTLLPTRQTGGSNDHKTNDRLTSTFKTKLETIPMEDKAVLAVSLSLGKSEIKGALESWVRSSVFTVESRGSKSRSPSSGTGKKVTNETSPKTATSSSSPSAAEVDLRRWITTGRSPRRAHLVHWLLQRLELVQAEAEEDMSDAGNEYGQPHDRRNNKRWLLVISNCEVGNSEKKIGSNVDEDDEDDIQRAKASKGVPVEHAASRKVGRQQQQQQQRPQGGLRAAPRIPAWQHGKRCEGGAREENRGQHQQWQWWDNENPWSRGSVPSTTATSTSSGPSRSESNSPPPPYRETAPPPPYGESVEGLAATPRSSSAHKDGSGQLQSAPPSLLLSGSAKAREDASTSSGDEMSRGPPPSYRSKGAGRAGDSTSSSGEGGEEERHHFVRDLPPPSYGRSYGHFSGTAAAPSCPETNRSGAKSCCAEWWAHDSYHLFPANKPRNQCEREIGRQQKHTSSRGGGGGGVRCSGGPHAFDSGAADISETYDGHQRLDGGGVTWGHRLRHHGGGGRRTISGLPLRGTEGWDDDDRWRLTRYLQACKKELTDAEERRRKAEAAANAAERTAWKTAADHGRNDYAAKREWVRKATQRVLDLMLVTERVRQEEQKRRVAAARASNQVARCKQPFRERRGRSQKGPFIGPSVPRTEATEPPRSQRPMEAALSGVFWDEHGRRYSRLGGGIGGFTHTNESSGEVGVAMETVRKVAAACLNEGTDFGQPFRDMDADGDGRLTLAEMGAALRRAGARLSLSQVTALFRHFSGGSLGLDTVRRGEFLWEFIDARRLLKQWRRAGEVSGGHRARTASFRNRAKKRSFGGRGSDGTLSRHDVSRALEDLGVRIDGWEAEALFDRFAVEMDGGKQVDWRSLVSFLQAAENNEDATDSGNDDDNNHKKGGRGVTNGSGRKNPEGLRTTLLRRDKGGSGFPHQRQDWATSRLHRGGGLFDGGGDAMWSHPRSPTEAPPPPPRIRSTSDKQYTHWASSAPTSGGRNNTAFSGKQIPTATTRSVGTNRPLPWKIATPSAASGLQPRGEGWNWRRRGGGGEHGGRLLTSAAEASKVLDRLLEDQREIETFLEEEFAMRERAAAGRGDFSLPQEVG